MTSLKKEGHYPRARRGGDKLKTFLHSSRARFRAPFLLLLLVALSSCDLLEPANDPVLDSPQEAAFQEWRRSCPEYSGEDGVRLANDRARDGDLRAIECQILFHEAVLTPYTDAEREAWEALTGSELNDDTGLARRDLFELLYVRWRLTGEGLETVEAHASTMPKKEIDNALFLSQFDGSRLPSVKTDLCGRTAEDDPGFRFVMLGQGERDPASCGPAIMDGRGAG